ncbi:MAG: FTR1 family protein [Gammaproteobacteria bacterium]|nr:FTR1 family protein [Gammaproteobacteria bacterium]
MLARCLTALFALSLSLPAVADPAKLAQLVDYVGVDYPVAVANGEVISEAEYLEMLEFSQLIKAEVEALAKGDTREALQPAAATLVEQIEAKAEPAAINETTAEMRSVLLASGLLDAAPRRVPQLAGADALYAQNCAACHGANGMGDGPAAPGMEPEPTNFHDSERAAQRTLYGLYNTISLGVDGTSMPAFPQLSDSQRWALAFYVGGMHVSPDTLAKGAAAFDTLPAEQQPDLAGLTATRLAEVAERSSLQADLHAYLRTNPGLLADSDRSPMTIAIASVDKASSLYAQGDGAAAYDMAVQAYLEGFELAEPSLRATHPELVLDIEAAMMTLRQVIKAGATIAEVNAAANAASELLINARDALDSEEISASVAFSSAFIILLREGLEAILILGAIAAFLRKTEHPEAMAWLHAGWIAALMVGVATWIVSNYVLAISGATREVTEGLTALLAAAILFYVGFWMHSKLNAARWQQFIQSKLQAAMDNRELWAIALIAFVAVYREVFETVLFFQALLAQVGTEGQGPVLGGFVAGAISILVSAWAILKFSVRLPLRQFFGATAYIMIALAVIFSGKGIAALQEAGMLPVDPVSFPRIELLGIYPNLQSLGLQLAVIAAAVAFIVYNARSTDKPAAA